MKEAKLEKAALIKEVRATFGVPPGIDAARPDAVSPWPGFSGRRLDRHRLAFDDGERGAVRASGGGGAIAGRGRSTEVSGSGSEAQGVDAVRLG